VRRDFVGKLALEPAPVEHVPHSASPLAQDHAMLLTPFR
jgi:hypothetical protein